MDTLVFQYIKHKSTTRSEQIDKTNKTQKYIKKENAHENKNKNNNKTQTLHKRELNK